MCFFKYFSIWLKCNFSTSLFLWTLTNNSQFVLHLTSCIMLSVNIAIVININYKPFA